MRQYNPLRPYKAQIYLGFIFFLISLVFASIKQCYSQQTNSTIDATTIDGKKVLLYTNGTWEYKNNTPKNLATNNCSDLIKETTDKVTGRKSISGISPIMISKNEKEGIIVSLYKGKDGDVTLMFMPVGASKCIAENQKANILFRDGSRLELLNQSEFNCDSDFFVFLGGPFGKKQQLNQLANTEIETLRVWTKDGFVEEDLVPEVSLKIMQTISCLMKP